MADAIGGAAPQPAPTPVPVTPAETPAAAPPATAPADGAATEGTQAQAGVDALGETPPAGSDPRGILARAGVEQPAALSADTQGTLALTDEDRAQLRELTAPVDLDDPESIYGTADYWFNDHGPELPAYFVRDAQGRIFELSYEEPGMQLQGEWLDASGQPVSGPVQDGTVRREVREWDRGTGTWSVTSEYVTYQGGAVVEAGAHAIVGVPGSREQATVDVVSGIDSQGRPFTTSSQSGTNEDGEVVVESSTRTTVTAADAAGTPTALEIEVGGRSTSEHGEHRYAGHLRAGDGTAPVDASSPASVTSWGEQWVGSDGRTLQNVPLVDESGQTRGGVVYEVAPGTGLVEEPPILADPQRREDGSYALVALRGSTQRRFPPDAIAYELPEATGSTHSALGMLSTAGTVLGVVLFVASRGSAIPLEGAGGLSALARVGQTLSLLPYLTAGLDEVPGAMVGTTTPWGTPASAALSVLSLLTSGGGDDRPDWVHMYDAVSDPDYGLA
jgi:hypothetical protein